MTQRGAEGDVSLAPTNGPSARIAIWGTFDLANFGDLLFPRIFELEMRRRLPAAEIRSFSPLGYLHPVPLDGGFMAEPLGPWSSERVRELAGDFDFVAIGGGEIVHPHDEYYGIWYGVGAAEAERLRPSRFFIEGLGEELESTTPVAWHSVGIPFELDGDLAERVRRACAGRSYVAVRDELSRTRLHRAGIEREIAVVPDSALVLDRLLSPGLLEQRREYLRTIGAFPLSAAPLVVQGSRNLLPHVEEIGRALADVLREHVGLPLVLLAAGPCHGDDKFADALAPYLPKPVQRMTDGFVVEDLAAAIAHARAFVGISLHGGITAFVHDVPFATLNLAAYSKLDAFAEAAGSQATLVSSPSDLRGAIRRVLAGERPTADVRSLVDRVDVHFDRMAELAERSARRRPGRLDGASPREPVREALENAEHRYATLRAAFDARGRRLVTERVRFAKLLVRGEQGDDRRRTHLELQGLLAELHQVKAELGEAERELSEARNALARAENEIARMRATKLYRYSASLRRAYARIRPGPA